MFGLVDCNNFYVSCERVFQPRLEGRPVVILSNNDGCIISRSAEAKALGLKMGDPYFQVKEQLRRDSVQVFSSNYTLYGDMSRRVMHYLGTMAPSVEIYSIDEAFLDLGGLEQHLTPYLGNLTDLAQRLRVGVKARTGIPVCVGVAPTKTLAKLANRLAKKDAGLDGVLYLDSVQRRAWALGQMAVGDVWGVGRQYTQKLTAAGIDSAADLSRVSEAWARKFLGGVVGARLVRELQGYPCAGLAPSEDGTLRRQSISCSRTFGRPLRERASVLGALSAFVARTAEKLRRQGDLAHVLTVFISKSRYGPDEGGHSRSAVLTLPVPTSDTRELTARAAQLLGRLSEPGAVYVKAGVVMAGLEAPGGQQLGLFGEAAPAAAGSYPAGSYPAGSYPAGSYPAGSYPAGSYPAGSYPAGAYPAGSYPAGSYPAGSYPAGSYPAGSYPAGSYPAGSYPAGSYPAGSYPAGSYPAGAYPAGSYPAGSYPAGSYPAGSYPAGSYPAGSYPAGAYPAGSYPAGSYPAGSYPAGSYPAGSYPAGSYPAGSYPAGSYPAGSYPAGSYPAGSYPAGSYPAGSYPAGSYPAGSYPAGSYPAGSYPAGSYPAGSYPAGSYPAGSYPAGSYPAGSYPAGAYPAGSYPAGSYPAGSYPAGSYPAGSYPAGSYPAGSYPAGAYPAGAYPAGAAVEGRSAQMMAALDGLNARFGRGTVQLAAALGPKGGGPVPWKGQAAWRTPAYTTRLEDLMMVK